MFPVKAGMTAKLERRITAMEVSAFAALSGDYNPLHTQSTYAAQTPFGGCVVHGAFLEALVSAVLGVQLPGTGAVYEAKTVRFRRPVKVGEMVLATVQVTKTQRIPRGQRAWLRFAISRGDGKVACDGTAVVQVWSELLSYSTLCPAEERLAA